MANYSVIGLIGKMHSGKSEVARHLVYNHGYVLTKFAEVLKAMLRTLGLTEEEIEGALKNEPCMKLMGETPRWAMKSLGTEWGRNLIHEDLWAYFWKQKASDILLTGKKVVVDDCRFLNESRFIRDFHPSTIWKIKKDKLLYSGDQTWGHQSETEHDQIEVDKTIKNYGSIGELKTNVDRLMKGE